MIPYGKHYIDDDDVQAVVSVLRGPSLTQGPTIDAFEEAFRKYVDVKYAVAVSSCTAALHLAVLAAGLRSGDTLITSPITFVASANAGLYVGAKVAFCDIDSRTITMDPEALATCLDENKDTRVVVPVHFAGLPCDMEKIQYVCESAGVDIIEDAAHALGATYQNGKRVGSCSHSLMTVFSLHPVKAIAAGEGGVITTNDENIYRKLLRLRSHGINKLSDSLIYPNEASTGDYANTWYYEMQELGFNYRITDIQCALALSQLNKLDMFVSARRELACLYHRAISELHHAVEAQPISLANNSAHHLYVVRVKYDELGISRAAFQSELMKMGIGSQVHYIPVPMQPYFRQLGHDINMYPISKEYYKECLSLPVYYALDRAEHGVIVRALETLLS